MMADRLVMQESVVTATAVPNLIPTPAAHAPLHRPTSQIAGRSPFRPRGGRHPHASNPHSARRQNQTPSCPRFRALALLRRLPPERVDASVMQASEKPAQKQR